MATVTYLDESYSCATALKGSDYVHLLDSNGEMIAAFDGVKDFSGFSITEGDWTSPTDDHNCYVAVVKDDGSMGKGGHKCSDILTGTVGIANGGTGATTAAAARTNLGALAADGNAVSATKLETARTVRTNLASTSTASFNGTANITPGVTGTLPVANGGTGNTIGAASALGSDVLKVIVTTVTTEEIKAGGYISQKTVTAAQENGYTLLYPLNVQSDSSYTLVYALWLTGTKFGYSVRNLSEKAVTPTLSIRGLYVKTS